MSKATYRLCEIILLAILVIGALVITFRWAENGRYVQFDQQKRYSPDGKTHHVSGIGLIDTRTGRLLPYEVP